MIELYEYTPEVPPTDLTLLPFQNRSVFGERFVDWLPYHIFYMPKRWGWN